MSAAPRNPRAPGKAGFTLLEVLLTSLLASVVLVSLWSLSDIYLRLFISGKRQIEETQLVRGLTEKIAKDVSQVIQIPTDDSAQGSSSRTTGYPSSRPAGTATSESRPQLPQKTSSESDRTASTGQPPVAPSQTDAATSKAREITSHQSERAKPKFGLFGTKQALRLIVLQTDPRTVREPTDLAEVQPQPGQARPPIASELRTIEYSYSWSRGSGSSENQHPPGLVRREWAWETWLGLRMANLVTSDSSGASEMMPESYPQWTADDELALEFGKDLLHVPQIVGLEFHYYDGENWDSEWNSWERRRLPQLVEVMLQIKINKDETTTETDDELSSEGEVSLSHVDENASNNDSTQSSGQGTIYRKLIHLPFADMQPAKGSDRGGNPQADEFRNSPRLGTNRP